MKSFKFLNLAALVLMGSLFVVSCSDDDSVTQEEKETAIETSANYEINSRSLSTDAYAAYCMQNGKESLVVSNNIDLVSGVSVLSPFEDLNVGDFVFQVVSDPASQGTNVIAASIFGETIGLSTQQNLLEFGPAYEITSNDGSVVIGTMNGTYLGFDENNEVYAIPHTLSFAASIVETSDFCN